MEWFSKARTEPSAELRGGMRPITQANEPKTPRAAPAAAARGVSMRLTDFFPMLCHWWRLCAETCIRLPASAGGDGSHELPNVDVATEPIYQITPDAACQMQTVASNIKGSKQVSKVFPSKQSLNYGPATKSSTFQSSQPLFTTFKMKFSNILFMASLAFAAPQAAPGNGAIVARHAEAVVPRHVDVGVAPRHAGVAMKARHVEEAVVKTKARHAEPPVAPRQLSIIGQVVEIVETLAATLTLSVAVLQATITAILDTVGEIPAELITDLVDALTGILDAVLDAVTAILAVTTLGLGLVLELLSSLSTGDIADLTAALTSLTDALALLTSILETITTLPETVLSEVSGLLTSLTGAIADLLDVLTDILTAVTLVASILNLALGSLLDVIGGLGDVIGDLIDGLDLGGLLGGILDLLLGLTDIF
ncbi:hypothetical protein S7711_11318 [Stachybotrys chartarum IBT 7711]|uniref:Uncharacterized protein n=1 Tax=Stachybotrys chartarum (strain CBS 109288 / IBT 7711) TaxID=1280523 RepID=A0A084ATA3_STACB|nr:hypothetical protein S7711_11318 [Stachybotrys chartarum IBT 7711]